MGQTAVSIIGLGGMGRARLLRRGAATGRGEIDRTAMAGIAAEHLGLEC